MPKKETHHPTLVFEVQAVSFREGYRGGLPSLLFTSICAAGFVSHREREEVWFCSVGRILKVWMVIGDRGEWKTSETLVH